VHGVLYCGRSYGIGRYQRGTITILPGETEPLIAVLGPTASGKSALALDVAERLGGEIVGCDSLQLYRYFNIGTAKTPPAQRRSIPHHLIDVLDPGQTFTAGDYARAAREVLTAIGLRHRTPVIAGGTGFYLRALLEGLFPGPVRDAELRQMLEERENRRKGVLHRWLRRVDAASAARVHPNDVQKLIRAIEVCVAGRQPMTEQFAQGRTALPGYRVLKIVLDPPRSELRARIDRRVVEMFEAGLIDEVRAILAAGWPRSAKPFESLGYKEALAVVEGRMTLEQAIAATQVETRQYAKRQATWFRRERGAEWFRGFGDDPAVRKAVFAWISGHNVR